MGEEPNNKMAVNYTHINKSFSKVKLYDDFSIQFKKNRINVIEGPSGCGKTTLLRMIAGLEKDDEDKNIASGDSVSIVFQTPTLLPWMTVIENVLFVLEHKDERLVRNILRLLELSEVADCYPYQLSGGMQQRVALARAFAYPSNLLIMDEPFTGLDISLKKRIFRQMNRMWRFYPKTIVLVTHNREELNSLAHRIITIGGRPVRITKETDREDIEE